MWIDQSTEAYEEYIYTPTTGLTYQIYKSKKPLYSVRKEGMEDYYKIFAKSDKDIICVAWRKEDGFKNLDFCKNHCQEHFNFFQNVFNKD